MSTNPIKTSILTGIPNATETNPVTHNTDPTLDNFCNALISNIQPYTKTRLDEVETALDALLTGLTTMATTFFLTGTTPVTGLALSTALSTLVAAASVNQPQRVIDKTTQDALEIAGQIPYFDGVK